MADSMYAADGIGLAAVQIGVPKRVLVIDLDQKEGKKNPRAYINPKILWASDEVAVYEEGCLSVPEIWDDVERPARIKCEYLDRDGNKQLLEADGLLATCLQHEMDHLNGVLFIDHLSRLKRSMAIKKLTKAKKLKETA
jgi:peptide deformylase